MLRRYGEVRPTSAGEVLFRQGDLPFGPIVGAAHAVQVADRGRGRPAAAGSYRADTRGQVASKNLRRPVMTCSSKAGGRYSTGKGAWWIYQSAPSPRPWPGASQNARIWTTAALIAIEMNAVH